MTTEELQGINIWRFHSYKGNVTEFKTSKTLTWYFMMANGITMARQNNM